jgi:hypothetical protein
MTTIAIREQLRNYLEIADNKKVKAIYTLVEDDMENDVLEYPEALKARLDEAEEYYNTGGKMISQAEMQRRLRRILKAGKKV